MIPIDIKQVGSLREEADLWISCHGYESRSIAHLDALSVRTKERVSFGFPFPDAGGDNDTSQRIVRARSKLTASGFEVDVVDDAGFESAVQQKVASLAQRGGHRLVADISSMSRSRMASLFLALVDQDFPSGCELDLVYFPGLFVTHKHEYEPLEHFGPCHPRLSGWPADPDLPLSVVLGLGTEPRRADGVLEMLEPDILALYMPIGDEREYQNDIVRENRRVLEVGGEPVLYSLREPDATYSSLIATAGRLARRSRVVFVPLGPKIFTAVTIAAAISLGQEVGVWKASAGRGVETVDVQASPNPVMFRVIIPGGEGRARLSHQDDDSSA